ncbi:phosphonate C-P lyase system protein PhnH [Robbsia sp. KACC 23696]|uniref:phosphonate C-P lyase system protein PhnH n=1 Tax=Robbsia sp. KACC 23696 TaxID=3149231 RepID=UPI00325A6DD2
MTIESPMTAHSGSDADALHDASARASHGVLDPVGPTSRKEPADAWMLRGFLDPVSGSQAAFRCALNALARPGRLHTMPDAARCEAPAGLSPAMAALLLTLADADTSVWLAPVFGEPARRFLRFHNGCPLTEHPEKAAFAVLSATDRTAVATWPSLSAFAQGELANPHGSTTLLIDVPFLADHAEAVVERDAEETATLRGPGIANAQTLRVAGLPDDFWREWRANHTRFPLGVDAFLINGASFCGLPRTTQRES